MTIVAFDLRFQLVLHESINDLYRPGYGFILVFIVMSGYASLMLCVEWQIKLNRGERRKRGENTGGDRVLAPGNSDKNHQSNMIAHLEKMYEGKND